MDPVPYVYGALWGMDTMGVRHAAQRVNQTSRLAICVALHVNT